MQNIEWQVKFNRHCKEITIKVPGYKFFTVEDTMILRIFSNLIKIHKTSFDQLKQQWIIMITYCLMYNI